MLSQPDFTEATRALMTDKDARATYTEYIKQLADRVERPFNVANYVYANEPNPSLGRELRFDRILGIHNGTKTLLASRFNMGRKPL